MTDPAPSALSALDPAEPLRVLLVDDDEVDRMSVARALRGFGPGLELVEVESADAALEALAGVVGASFSGASFDCVLSDLHMPGRGGDWLLQRMRQEEIDVPFIALTGQGDEQTAVAMIKAGAADYINKGVATPGRLGQVLRHVIRAHRAEREAQQAERERRRTEERLRLALEVTGLGTWDVDVLLGQFECDERCRALFGLPPAPFYSLEQGFSAIHPEDRPKVDEVMRQALDPAGGGRYEAEFRTLNPTDGSIRWIRSNGQVYLRGGHPARLVGTVLDVTARKRDEETGRRRAEFEQQLIGIVSHDLRNPISAMMMGAALLARRLPADSPLASTAGRILSSGERAARLIRDLLDFTQARSAGGIPIQRRAADIHAVCRQTLEEVALNHPARAVHHRVEGQGWGLWDPDRLAQVISNLTVNAVSYSPIDTPVIVTSIGLEASIALEIRNQGPPIPADVLPTLFEPFKRRDRRQDPDRSIGLGLFIVREIVAAHGGTVKVRSSAEEGTIFRVEVPRGARSLDEILPDVPEGDGGG